MDPAARYIAFVRRHGWCPGWWITLEISTDVQESRKTDTKIDIKAFASHLEADRDEVALLPETKPLRKQTWWQKLSQSLNMAGVWLFLRVLFVSPPSPCCTVTAANFAVMTLMLILWGLHHSQPGTIRIPHAGGQQASRATCERAQHSMGGLGGAQKGGI